MKKQCDHCNKEMQGRSDKRFCCLECKNRHAAERRSSTRDAVAEVDKWLHRNRDILLTLMGNSTKEQFDRAVLTRTGFKYEFHTGTYLNKEGKMYRLIYDFAWMEFSDQKILVIRKKSM